MTVSVSDASWPISEVRRWVPVVRCSISRQLPYPPHYCRSTRCIRGSSSQGNNGHPLGPLMPRCLESESL